MSYNFKNTTLKLNSSVMLLVNTVCGEIVDGENLAEKPLESSEEGVTFFAQL